MDDYVTKPIDPAALTGVLAAALGRNPAVNSATHASERPRAPGDHAATWPCGAVDWPELVARCMGNEALAAAALERFVVRAPELIDEVNRSCREGAFEALHGLLHQLKGMAGNVAAHGVYTAAADMESAPSPSSLWECAAGLESLSALVDRVALEISGQPSGVR